MFVLVDESIGDLGAMNSSPISSSGCLITGNWHGYAYPSRPAEEGLDGTKKLFRNWLTQRWLGIRNPTKSF
jgi:hypothetical protein